MGVRILDKCPLNSKFLCEKIMKTKSHNMKTSIIVLLAAFSITVIAKADQANDKPVPRVGGRMQLEPLKPSDFNFGPRSATAAVKAGQPQPQPKAAPSSAATANNNDKNKPVPRIGGRMQLEPLKPSDFNFGSRKQ
jgi:hypothetical protein